MNPKTGQPASPRWLVLLVGAVLLLLGALMMSLSDKPTQNSNINPEALIPRNHKRNVAKAHRRRTLPVFRKKTPVPTRHPRRLTAT